MQQGMEKPNNPDNDSHLDKDLMTHDKKVTKWFAHSHKVVKNHQCQQQGLCAAQEVEEMKLAYASQERNCFVCREEVLQHLWKSHCGVADI